MVFHTFFRPATTLHAGTAPERLISTPPHPQLELCVTIPVRNEAQHLPATLRALAQQTDMRGRPFPAHRYEVLLLANNCTDDTVAVARHFARAHPRLRLHIIDRSPPPGMAHVGWARRTLMDEACGRLLKIGRPRGVISTTDGDTRVAPTWVAATLREIANGADAVGGNILTDPGEVALMETGERWFHTQDVRYKRLLAHFNALHAPDQRDPWPRHYHHTGASLALTAALYRQVGGLPPLPFAEDVALYQNIVRAGACFRHSLDVEVVTSVRQRGRAANGMADKLKEWHDMARSNQPLLVEPFVLLAERSATQRALRQQWRATQHGSQANTANALAEQLQVEPHWLADMLSTRQPFGALMHGVETASALFQPQETTEISATIRDLEQRLADR